MNRRFTIVFILFSSFLFLAQKVEASSVFYSTSSDGYGVNGGVNTGSASGYIGQQHAFGKYGSSYYRWRVYLFFNTSSIPDGATINSAKLSLYGYSKLFSGGGRQFAITTQSGQPDYPHDPLQDEDDNGAYYSGNGGSISTVNFITGMYNDIVLNSDGINWINKTGTTKLAIRSSYDIADSWPDPGWERISVYLNEKGSGYQPMLLLDLTYPDSTLPTYSDNQTNSTDASLPAEFSLTIGDDSLLQSNGQYEFAIDNCTGSFVKEDLVNFISTPQDLSVTKVINSTVGCNVRWYFNFSDNMGNWNDTLVSTPFSFLTTDETPPTFSGNQVNTTKVTLPANFTINVTDVNILNSTAGYIFSTNNSGTWLNSSYNAFTGSGTTLTAWNVTILNSTDTTLVQWRFYANDTYNNWAASDIYSLTTEPDPIPPTFSGNQTSSTDAGTPANFTINVTDNNNLNNTAGYIFSTNNSGAWTNATYAPFDGSATTLTAWSVTTLNSTVGTFIQWIFFANDTYHNWNVSETYNLTIRDGVPPTFSNSATNSTGAGTPARFTIDVTDNVALDSTAGYIFSTDNSGTWINATYVPFTGSATTLTASNVTIINSTEDVVIQWRFYANDTYNNWAASDTYSLTTAPAVITVNLTSYIVWWNDSVTAYGKALDQQGNVLVGTPVNLRISNVRCNNVSTSSGDWSCRFNTPLEIGTYIVYARIGTISINTTTLTVKPKYGETPIGRSDRMVYEQPMLIQEPSGKIRIVWVRTMVWI